MFKQKENLYRQNNKFKILRACGSLKESILLKLCGAHDTQVVTYFKRTKYFKQK